MKKLFDRRMCGFILCIFVMVLILVILALVSDKVAPFIVQVAPLIVGGLITLLGILVTGNVVQAVKGKPDAPKAE